MRKTSKYIFLTCHPAGVWIERMMTHQQNDNSTKEKEKKNKRLERGQVGISLHVIIHFGGGGGGRKGIIN